MRNMSFKKNVLQLSYVRSKSNVRLFLDKIFGEWGEFEKA